MMAILLFFLFCYIMVVIGYHILKHKVRKKFQEFNKQASHETTDYPDGHIFYQKNSHQKKHFSQSDGEYVDYEEIK